MSCNELRAKVSQNQSQGITIALKKQLTKMNHETPQKAKMSQNGLKLDKMSYNQQQLPPTRRNEPNDPK